jgi:signal transduction histidine kinase
MYKLKNLVFFLVILFSFTCNKVSSVPTPLATQGILDLRSMGNTDKAWDFQKDGILKLDGEWEFYPNEFLKTTPQWEADRTHVEKKFIRVPSSWENFQKENNLDRIYYGTYRLKILLPNANTYLSIKLPVIGSSYTLYSNGVLISSRGKVGTTKEESIPNNQVGIYDFIHEQDSIELIIHVSNFVYENGSGLWESLILGIAPDIHSLSKYNIILDAISFGTLFIVAIYHFCFYFLRKNDKAAFYFGLLCFAVSIRSILYGERIILDIPFFKDQYFLTIRLEFLFLYLILPTFNQYLKIIFPIDFVKDKLINSTFYLGCIFSLISLVTPISIYTHTLILRTFQIVMICLLLYLCFRIPKLILQKREGAKSFSIGILINFITALNDVLYINKIINTEYLGPFGFIAFVFAQAILLASRFSKGFIESEKLSEELKQKSDRLEETSLELQTLNKNLEIKILERTMNLQEAKKEIEELNSFTHLVNSLTDINQIFIEVSKYMNYNYGILGSWLFLPNEKQEYLYPFKVYSYDKIPQKKFDYMMNLKIPLKEKDGGMFYKVYQRKKSFYLSKIPKFEFEIDKKIIEAVSARSFFHVPLIRKDECVGIFTFSNIEKEMKLSKNEIRKISNLCSQISGAIDLNHLLKQVQEEKEKALIAQKETEKAKNEIEKLAESRKRLSMVGQMVAGIVHDIKNPIASIKGLAERLNSDTIKPEKRERNTRMILQEMDRLSDMVYEILDFSKGKINLEISRVNIVEYLNEIIQFQQTLLDYNSIRAVKNFQFTGEIDLDISRMRRVISNLIQNSVEVMYDAKKEYYVKVATDKTEDHYLILVEDNGPGLPESMIEKIFEAFATEGKAKGTGLGLYMSKMIVEAHGGELSFESKKGQGTTFFIKIPIQYRDSV